jgi:flagellar biogenesis protein FliO
MKQLPISTDPKKFLKLIISFSFVLLVIWAFALIQADRPEPEKELTPREQARLDSVRSILGRENIQMQQPQEYDFGSKALVVVFVLGGGLAIAWWYLRKQDPGKQQDWITVLGEQSIDDQNTIKALKFQDEVWIVAVTPNGMNLLKTIPAEEFDADNLKKTSGQTQVNKDLFKTIFQQKRSES